MKPILFNTDMVRAILAGRKAVTRRLIKPTGIFKGWTIKEEISCMRSPTGFGFLISNGEKSVGTFMYMPYRPDDILYARETFKIDYLSNIPGTGRIRYKADDAYSDFTFAPERYEMMRRAQLKPGWRPNENMPHEAARIFLRVTDVRVERLQDITYNGCLYEGITAEEIIERDALRPSASARCLYGELWDSTIKPADRALYGWGPILTSGLSRSSASAGRRRSDARNPKLPPLRPRLWLCGCA